MDVIRLDRLNHILHHGLPTNIHPTDRADVGQSIHDVRLALRVARTKEANQANDALELDALEGLLERAGTADLEDVIDTLTLGRDLAGRLAPVAVGLVVDYVVGAELPELLSLLGAGCCRDDGGTSGFGELYRCKLDLL